MLELIGPACSVARTLQRSVVVTEDVDLNPEIVISRTEGVTASFLKELLRRAALPERSGRSPCTAAGQR